MDGQVMAPEEESVSDAWEENEGQLKRSVSRGWD